MRGKALGQGNLSSGDGGFHTGDVFVDYFLGDIAAAGYLLVEEFRDLILRFLVLQKIRVGFVVFIREALYNIQKYFFEKYIDCFV